MGWLRQAAQMASFLICFSTVLFLCLHPILGLTPTDPPRGAGLRMLLTALIVGVAGMAARTAPWSQRFKIALFLIELLLVLAAWAAWRGCTGGRGS
jgi:hypothetical protein